MDWSEAQLWDRMKSSLGIGNVAIKDEVRNNKKNKLKVKCSRESKMRKIREIFESESSEEEEKDFEEEKEDDERLVECKRARCDSRGYATKKGGMLLHIALNTIPQFDGKSKLLRSFIATLRDLVESYGRENEKWILRIMSRKLKGKAAAAFEGTIYKFTSVEELIDSLKLMFGYLQDKESLKVRMNQSKQKNGEHVQDYARFFERFKGPTGV